MALTAEDLGMRLKDNQFGCGRIKSLPAIEYALEGEFPPAWCYTQ